MASARYQQMHTYRRILFVMKECEPDKEAEFAATFLHHFVGRRAEIAQLAREEWPGEADKIEVKMMYEDHADGNARAAQVIPIEIVARVLFTHSSFS